MSPASDKTRLDDEAVTRFVLHTGQAAGAVAIVQLDGPAVTEVLAKLTGRAGWQADRATLADFKGFDHGLVIVAEGGRRAQLMPHGGPRVVQRLMDELVSLGARPTAAADVDSWHVYPEARSRLEADAMMTLARAASPAAVDLLLVQHDAWRAMAGCASCVEVDELQRIGRWVHDRSRRLGMLVEQPTVAVVGRPNVGKSTLTNLLLGREASIVADLPGTTRDWVAGSMQLPSSLGYVAVRWLDTPGVRQSDDLVEQQAIGMAAEVIRQAHVVVAMRDAQEGWLLEHAGGRQPHLWVVNKAEAMLDAQVSQEADAGSGAQRPLYISAKENLGVDQLAARLLRALGLEQQGDAQACPASLAGTEAEDCWAFSPVLERVMETYDWETLHAYVAMKA